MKPALIALAITLSPMTFATTAKSQCQDVYAEAMAEYNTTADALKAQLIAKYTEYYQTMVATLEDLHLVADQNRELLELLYQETIKNVTGDNSSDFLNREFLKYIKSVTLNDSVAYEIAELVIDEYTVSCDIAKQEFKEQIDIAVETYYTKTGACYNKYK